MQCRWWHCCTFGMSANISRSFFRTYMFGVLSLAMLITFFIYVGHLDRMPTHHVPRRNPSTNTKGEVYRDNFLRELWWGKLDSRPSLSSQQVDGVAGEAARRGGEQARRGFMWLEDAKSTGNSLRTEMGAGGPYRYILNEPFKCRDSTPFLILLIFAEPGQADERNAIRQTWGNEGMAKDPGFTRLFLLGTGKIDPVLQSSIEKESSVYHDIIQQDYQDTYYNLTIKTLMGMNWVATYCPHASYVMKTDSNMFVNTEYLIQKFLKPEQPPPKKYFTGYLMRGYAPNRNKNSKWYMPRELYPSERYPPFCSGTGYVFSGDMAKLIYQASLSIPRLHLEDVYVGICLAKLQIDITQPRNNSLFNIQQVPYSSCRYSQLVTSHQILPKLLIKFWNDLQINKHTVCVNKTKENKDTTMKMGETGLGDYNTTRNSLQKVFGVGGPYRYILNEPFKCRDSAPFLVLLITTESRKVDARNAIRQTWGNESIAKDQGFIRLFLLGTGKIDPVLQSSIEKESSVYHDIIQQDYQDTYYNLTIKTLMGMYWVKSYCPHASYVMKTDCDMFVNTENLIQNLLLPDLPPKKKYFTGFVMANNSPIRDTGSKWYMSPKLYAADLYPTFCSGTGYVFSGDLATLIYQVSHSIPMLHLEDVYVGVCLSKLNISPTRPPNDHLFHHWWVAFNSCTYRNLITSHYFTPNDIIRIWNYLQTHKNEQTCVAM